MKPTLDERDRAESGSEYFKRCLGTNGHTPAVHGKHTGSHPQIIHDVYQEALARFPAAADVIACLVFREVLNRNREEFLARLKKENPDG